MVETVEFSPVRCAELVAPVISRVFVAGMRAGGADGRELVAGYGGGRVVGYLIDLRNPLAAGRSVTPDGLAEHYRYDDPDIRHETVQRSVEHGLLDQAPDQSVTAGERGQAFLRDLFTLHGRALSERWGHLSGQVERLNELVSLVLAEAAATGGGAWAVQAPPHEPPGTPAEVLLLNRLSTLRYHRSDAHAAAWRAAGLTAAEMQAMPWGSWEGGGGREKRSGTPWTPQRRAVERDTNERAAAPYQVLAPEQRLTLLADLAALP